jgi:hypothetical protein
MAIELSTITFTFQHDIVPASGVEQLFNTGITNTFAGNDILTGTGSTYGLVNYGTLNTGDDNDTIIGNSNNGYTGISNASGASIQTGSGNDTIISTGVIYNEGSINTGDGSDFILANQDFSGSGNGTVHLGSGDDHIKGFGPGWFYGDGGNDILELPPGTYTFVNWYGAGQGLQKGKTYMRIQGFEQLIAGNTTYHFSSLAQTQTIIV